jgi:integrase
MRTRGLGRVYQPTYRDRKTRDLRTSPTWWIAYSFRGVKHRESSGSAKRSDAVKLLRRRLEEMSRGRLVGPDADKLTFDALTEMVLTDYKVNSRKSVVRAESAIGHLRAFFGFAHAPDVTSDRVNSYIRARQEAGAQPASIRYELAILKRAFTIAVQVGKLAHRPYIPSIEVRNTRTGFFERSDFEAVRDRLPVEVRPVVTFAYMTGWRIRSEVLPIQWSRVDMKTGSVRLDPGTTKNDEGRVFPFIAFPELAEVLQRQREYTSAVERQKGIIVPWVFHRNSAPIKDFRGAWKLPARRPELLARFRMTSEELPCAILNGLESLDQ